MTEDFIDAVREEMQTPLSRLGSSKAIYADTRGEMEDDVVVATAAANERAAAQVFDDWADELDGPLADAFADAAALASDHVDELEGRTDVELPDASVVYKHLAEYDEAVECLGAFVGRGLVEHEKTTQRTGYFTGQADPQTASVFREFGEDFEAQLDQAVDLLAGQCDGDDDWQTAEDAAVEVVEVAYDEYVEVLESLGVNPKNVC